MVDTRLQFQLQHPDILSTLTQGIDLAQEVRNAPILDRLLQQREATGEQNLRQGEQEITQAEQEQALRAIQLQGRVGTVLLGMDDIEDRRAFLNNIRDTLIDVGITPEEIDSFPIDDDERIREKIDQAQTLFPQKTIGSPVIGQVEGGGFGFATMTPGGGRVTPLPRGFVPTGAGGETPTQKETRRGREERAKEAARVEGFGGRREIEESTEAAIAGERARGAGISKRQTDDIAEGRDAASGIPVLRRSLQLLDFIKTGGIDAARLQIKQFFGIEGADEGELSSNLGKAVLSQLRATFGAQFTEREGARLEGIEARFGASPATNRRLLQQTLTIVENAANRGIRAAIAAKDFRAAADIQEAMDLDLTPAPVGLTDEQEARRQELLRKQAEGTLDAPI